MKRLFIDTSFWIALYRRRDTLHARAATLWRRCEREPALLFTTDYVVDEMATLLAARAGHSASVSALEATLASPRVTLIPVYGDHFAATCAAWHRFKERYSFTDVSSFVVMRALQMDAALAFDDDFQRAGFVVMDER